MTHWAVDEDQGQGREKIAYKYTESPAVYEDPLHSWRRRQGKIALGRLAPNHS